MLASVPVSVPRLAQVWALELALELVSVPVSVPRLAQVWVLVPAYLKPT
jgi:hypothetical protein